MFSHNLLIVIGLILGLASFSSDPPPVEKSDWISFPSVDSMSTYSFNKKLRSTFSEAYKFCKVRQGQLAAIPSPDHQFTVLSNLPEQDFGHTQLVYIGAYTDANGIARHVDTDEPLFWSNFSSGTDDSRSVSFGCLALNTSDGSWKVVSCNEKLHFLCSSSNKEPEFACPGNFFKAGTSCFQIFDNQESYRNWAAANESCSNQSEGLLASIGDLAVHDHITARIAFQQNPIPLWVGNRNSERGGASQHRNVERLLLIDSHVLGDGYKRTFCARQAQLRGGCSQNIFDRAGGGYCQDPRNPHSSNNQ